MRVAIVASNLNELKCSEYTAIMKTCYDYQRLKAFSIVVQSNKQNSYEHYYYLLGNSKVDVQIVTGVPLKISLFTTIIILQTNQASLYSCL